MCEAQSRNKKDLVLWFSVLVQFLAANAISEQRGTTLRTGLQKQPSPAFVKACGLQLSAYYLVKNPIQITAEFRMGKLTELEHITKLASCILQHYPLEFKAAL